MSIGRLVKQWILPVILAVIALVSWRAANNADFDQATNVPEDYELSAETPLLSARRIPKTLRAPVSDARIADPINQTIANTTFPQMCISVRFGDRPLGDSRELVGGLVPASNQKLLTTYAALGILGPDFVFSTRVTATAPIEAGVVRGDLYLIGAGDPFLYTDDWLTQYPDLDGRSSTRLEDLADAVAATGLTQVTGTIFGDESLFDQERTGPWDSRLIEQKQSGPLSALSLNEGFTQWPAEFPGTARVRSSAADPALNAAAVFGQLLAERGVSVAGAPAVGVNLPGSVELAAVQSPPLSATVTHINSYSSNIGAELLLKRLGFERFGSGTTRAGTEAVINYLTEAGIPMEDVQIFDGSGLAETNRLTCTAITEILASAGPNTPFGQSLSISGSRGSLLTRFVDTVAEGNVLAKTGTLRNVRSLSGYVQSAVDTDPGAYVSFAYIVNDDMVIEGDVDVFLQTPLVTALTTYPSGPNVSVLSPLDPVRS
ncbi:MAG: D-alanyl-D-alanine carboxypeptidase/D-alanyl-D-alanine-endopeptidase [Actinomycetota bacterium]